MLSTKTAPATQTGPTRLEQFEEWNAQVAHNAALKKELTSISERVEYLRRRFKRRPSIEEQADALARGNELDLENAEASAKELEKAERRQQLLELAVPRSEEVLMEIRRKVSRSICETFRPEYLKVHADVTKAQAALTKATPAQFRDADWTLRQALQAERDFCYEIAKYGIVVNFDA
jgi:hypothetical protein